MRQLLPTTMIMMALAACGGAQRVGSPATAAKAEPRTEAAGETDTTTDTKTDTKTDTPRATASGDSPGASAEPSPAAKKTAGPDGAFVLRSSNAAGEAQPGLKPTATEAAMKFTVVDKDKGPVTGIVISLTAPDGKKHYTEETDAAGHAEVLVPIGQKYDLVFLSLGRRDIAATVTVSDEPRQNIRLTLRYKRQSFEPVPAPEAPAAPPRFVLNGVRFDTGKATIRAESFPRLDGVVEFMIHKKRARIEIAGHTDNVGNPKSNKTLSERRARACRDYLISKGIDGSRVTAVGYGGERPLAPNDTEEGRQTNRRIEATEL